MVHSPAAWKGHVPVTSSEPPATPGKPLETGIIRRDPSYGDAIVFMGREIAAAIREGLAAIAETQKR